MSRNPEPLVLHRRPQLGPHTGGRKQDPISLYRRPGRRVSTDPEPPAAGATPQGDRGGPRLREGRRQGAFSMSRNPAPQVPYRRRRAVTHSESLPVLFLRRPGPRAYRIHTSPRGGVALHIPTACPRESGGRPGSCSTPLRHARTCSGYDEGAGMTGRGHDGKGPDRRLRAETGCLHAAAPEPGPPRNTAASRPRLRIGVRGAPRFRGGRRWLRPVIGSAPRPLVLLQQPIAKTAQPGPRTFPARRSGTGQPPSGGVS